MSVLEQLARVARGGVQELPPPADTLTSLAPTGTCLLQKAKGLFKIEASGFPAELHPAGLFCWGGEGVANTAISRGSTFQSQYSLSQPGVESCCCSLGASGIIYCWF